MSRGFSSIVVLFTIVIVAAFSLGYYFSKISSSLTQPVLKFSTPKPEILTEKIPGSKFHSPDATWWGYNQSKIVRYKNLVFTYYVDNDDDSNKTSSRLVILKKDGENNWEEGAIFSTSRPGNLLIDSQGILHAFVFEPFDVSVNDSWGKIFHYYFPNSAAGDVKNYRSEVVVDNDGRSETANIRAGAAIGDDDTIAISFGLTKFNPLYNGQSEHIYFKKPNETSWSHIFTDGLGHDYYYPFTLVSDNSFYLLPIQDDFAGAGNPNIYQKILLLEANKDGSWKQEMVADLSNHPLAKTRPRLLEQEDLYEDKDGYLHLLYKEFLDERNNFAATVHWHLTGRPGSFKSEQIKLDNPGVNWIRFIEVNGNLYYLLTTYGEVFISPVDNLQLTKIKVPEDVHNNYPYVVTAKSGSTESDFIDMLLLGADKRLYEQGQFTNYYLRIPKTEFTKLE